MPTYPLARTGRGPDDQPQLFKVWAMVRCSSTPQSSPFWHARRETTGPWAQVIQAPRDTQPNLVWSNRAGCKSNTRRE